MQIIVDAKNKFCIIELVEREISLDQKETKMFTEIDAMHKSNYEKLVRFAELTKDINPSLMRDIEAGHVTPCNSIMELVDTYLGKHDK